MNDQYTTMANFIFIVFVNYKKKTIHHLLFIHPDKMLSGFKISGLERAFFFTKKTLNEGFSSYLAIDYMSFWD